MSSSIQIQQRWLKAILMALIVCGFTASNSVAFAAAPASEQHASDAAHAAPEHDYSLPPLYFDAALFVFTLVLFTVLMFGMKSTVWQPLIHNLNAREGRIVQAELDAKGARKEILELTAKAELRLAEVQQQVAGILAQARKDGEAQKAQITAQAEIEAKRIRESALAAISKARTQAVQELDQVASEHVSLATEHVAGLRF